MARVTVADPGYQLIRRNGTVTRFDPTKITLALTKAFLAVEGSSAASSRRIHDVVGGLTQQIVSSLTRRADLGHTFLIEDVQDQVELALMRGEYHKVARAYVLYREERAKQRIGSAKNAQLGPRITAPRDIRRRSRRPAGRRRVLPRLSRRHAPAWTMSGHRRF